MKIRVLSKREVDAKPYVVWNAFVNLLAMESYRDLTPEQRAAHLVFWYEHEVQNGGHLQFFENRGTEYVNETIAALGVLGAVSQQQILRDASDRWLSRAQPSIATVNEYCETALQGAFDEYDRRFYDCEPSLQKKLEEYLSRHQSLFVAIE